MNILYVYQSYLSTRICYDKYALQICNTRDIEKYGFKAK